MRGRALLVQGAIAAGALAAAAVVWLQPAPQGAPGEVPVAPLARGEVKAGHWDDGSHRVDVWRASAPDRTVWGRAATSPSLRAPDGGVVTDGGTAIDAGPTPARADAGSGPRSDAGAAPALRADAGTRGRSDAGTGPNEFLRALKEAPPPPDRELRGNEMAE